MPRSLEPCRGYPMPMLRHKESDGSMLEESRVLRKLVATPLPSPPPT